MHAWWMPMPCTDGCLPARTPARTPPPQRRSVPRKQPAHTHRRHEVGIRVTVQRARLEGPEHVILGTTRPPDIVAVLPAAADGPLRVVLVVVDVRDVRCRRVGLEVLLQPRQARPRHGASKHECRQQRTTSSGGLQSPQCSNSSSCSTQRTPPMMYSLLRSHSLTLGFANVLRWMAVSAKPHLRSSDKRGGQGRIADRMVLPQARCTCAPRRPPAGAPRTDG